MVAPPGEVDLLPDLVNPKPRKSNTGVVTEASAIDDIIESVACGADVPVADAVENGDGIVCAKCSEMTPGAWFGCDNRDCGLWWHKDCLDTDSRAFAELSVARPEDVLFYCPACSNGHVCGACFLNETTTGNNWLKCGDCDTYFHFECLNDTQRKLILRLSKDEQWFCFKCSYDV